MELPSCLVKRSDDEGSTIPPPQYGLTGFLYGSSKNAEEDSVSVVIHRPPTYRNITRINFAMDSTTGRPDTNVDPIKQPNVDIPASSSSCSACVPRRFLVTRFPMRRSASTDGKSTPAEKNVAINPAHRTTFPSLAPNSNKDPHQYCAETETF